MKNRRWWLTLGAGVIGLAIGYALGSSRSTRARRAQQLADCLTRFNEDRARWCVQGSYGWSPDEAWGPAYMDALRTLSGQRSDPK